MKIKKTVTVLILCSMIVCSTSAVNVPTAQANWFSSFTDNMVKHSGSAWSLQQQGHFAGGGFSMRYTNTKKPLMNITAPKISVGCGGIDAFWGGFSFLDPEYFIQMFRNILQAAPAFAFKLALDSLCEQCGSALVALNDLANAMNALSVDECGMAQALGHGGGAAIANIFSGKSETGDTSGTATEWLESLTGYTRKAGEYLKDFNKMLEHKYCENKKGSFLESCKSIYSTKGSLWEKVKAIENLEKRAPLDDTTLGLMRALTGDIMLNDTPMTEDKEEEKADPTVLTATLRNPCEYSGITDHLNLMTSPKGITDQNSTLLPFWMPGDSHCTRQTYPEKLLLGKKVSKAISEIEGNMQNSPTSPLSQETIDVIERNSYPIYKVLNVFATRSRLQGTSFMGDDEREKFTRIATLGHATYILNSLIQKANNVFAKTFTEVISVTEDAGASKQQFESAMHAFNGNVTKVMDTLAKNHAISDADLRDFVEKMVSMQNLAKELERAALSSFYN